MTNGNYQDIRNRPEGVLLRTYLSVAGVSPDSFHKPLVGVATCSTQVFSERPDARNLGEAAISGVEAAGGLARRWDMTRSPDLMSWGHAEGYTFAWRDQLADVIESWAQQETLDGLVMVGDAPESLVGMAMAACRLNIPAILVPISSVRWEFPAQSESSSGKNNDLSDPYELLTEKLFGKKKSSPEQELFTKCLMSQDNHESNAVYFALEGLGICLPGVSTASPKTARLHELAFASGERLIALIKSATPLRRILNGNAFANAARLNAALGGSVDVAIHLMALAQEAGVPLSLELFDRIGRETPQVANLGGVAEKAPHGIEEFDQAGGVWSTLHALKSHVLPTNTLSGRGAMDLAKTSDVKNTHIISESRPVRKQSGLGVLRGNLAPHGALFLFNQVIPELSPFRGPVKIFDQDAEAAKAVNEGRVKKGMAIIVRFQGPKSGPGLKKLRILPALLESRGLNKFIPVLTDGRLPDTPAGLFISCISPESGTRGAFGVMRDDDVIDIDINLRSLIVRLTQTDMNLRFARWQAPELKSPRSFLSRYSRSVSEVSEGAVLK